MSRRALPLLAFVITTLSLHSTVPSLGSVRAAEPVTLETIAKAWQDRQDRVKSARFVWTERRTDAKGALSSIQPPIPPGMEDPWGGKVLPPKDITYETPVKAEFQGDALHYSYTAQFWSPKEDRLKKMPYLNVFDGKVGKYLNAGGHLNASWPSGDIKAQPYHTDARNPQLRPVLMTYRARHPKMRTYDIEQMSLTGRRAVIGGQSCMELIREVPAFRGAAVVHLWVDPARDFVIVREVDTVDNRSTAQIDVRFQADPACGWIPHSWDIIKMHPDGSGRLHYSTKATVTEHEINCRIDAKEFDIEWPIGTYVTDVRSNRWFIVTPTGDREVPKDELSKPYEELIQGPATPSRGALSWTPRVLAGLAVCIASGVLLAWRLWSRKVRHEGGEGHASV